MGIFDEHQYTSITAIIDRIAALRTSGPDDAAIETELPGLLDVISMQGRPGQVEAARAVRKKLKYGSVKEQLNGLSLVELLVANASGDFSAFVNDDKLLERLRVNIRDSSTDPEVKKRTLQLVVGWHQEYRSSSSKKSLYRLFQETNAEKFMKRGSGRRRSTVPNFMDDEADQTTPFEEIYETSDEESVSTSSTSATPAPQSSFKAPWKRHEKKPSQPKTNAELDRKYKIPKIDYTKEQPKILALIAESTTLAVLLENTLKTLPEGELSIHSVKANEEFDKCRSIRRKVLRYLQLVNREELVGGLLHANDQLVAALKSYEEASYPHDEEGDEDSIADYEIDDESISINWDNHRPPPPPPVKRSPSPENDPFGDKNAVDNPVVWR